PEDGPRGASGLRPDVRAQVGPVDGRVRELGRDVQQLRDRAGRGPHRPGRHLPARLSAPPRDAHQRDPRAARADQARAARREPCRGGRGGGGRRPRGDADVEDDGAAAMSDVNAGAQAREVTAPRGPGGETVDVRLGMFGVKGSGDTSGFGGLVTPVVMPGPSPRPYGGWFDEVVDVLAELLEESGTGFDAAIEQVVVDRGE